VNHDDAGREGEHERAGLISSERGWRREGDGSTEERGTEFNVSESSFGGRNLGQILEKFFRMGKENYNKG